MQKLAKDKTSVNSIAKIGKFMRKNNKQNKIFASNRILQQKAKIKHVL